MLDNTNQNQQKPSVVDAVAPGAARLRLPANTVSISPNDEQDLLQQALNKINGGRLAELNPTVGDSACQLTAFALVTIARKMAMGIPLSSGEKQFLIGSEILTSASSEESDVLGTVFKDKRAEERVPVKTNPDNKMSRINFSILTTTNFVDFRIKYLTDAIASNPELREVYGILTDTNNRKYLQRVARMTYELTCLPLLAIYEAILMSELMAGNPILITVKRMSRTLLNDDKQSLKLQGIETFMFKPNVARDKFEFCQSPTQVERQAPCIHMYGNSIINIGVESMGGMPLNGVSTLPFLNSPSFEVYKDEFVSENIMNTLRLCLVLHKQYPGRIEGQACFESPEAQSNLAYTYRYYNMLNYEGVAGIPENTMLYPTGKVDVLTSEEITFAIEHTFADTYLSAATRNSCLRGSTLGNEIVAAYNR